MIRLDAALYEHLRSGGTLAVSSRQRAAAVQLAYAQARLAAGDQTWPSPDVLPVAALLVRESAHERRASGSRRRQLTPTEEWALWRAAAAEAGGNLQLLSIGALASGLHRQHQLLADWDLRQAVLATPEGEWLLRTQRRFRQRREALQALDREAWREDTDTLSTRVLVASPLELGIATSRALVARGASLHQPAAAMGAVAGVIAASNADAEFEQMAQWARAQLERDPAARVLLVIPDLDLQISAVQRFLDENFREPELAGDAADDNTVYAIEGGHRLVDAPLVQAALLAVQLAAGTQPFARVASLLRSASLDMAHAGRRLELERSMRECGLCEAGWQELAEFAAAAASGGAAWFEAVAVLVRDWRVERAPPSRWAQRFAGLWQELGWPGSAALGSAEQQRRMRFDELVGEFAGLDDVLGSVDLAAAIEILAAWVSEARFEPASGDVPVTVTARLDDPLVSYDAIWVAGLTAESWPPPAELGGFVSATALQQAGEERASADGQLARARRCMRQWSRCTARLVYSWARVNGEAEASPSPLLAGLEAFALTGAMDEPRCGVLQPAVALEACGPDQARPWPAATYVPGGVGLLQAQSHCPFKASAMARLGCEPLPAPAAGVRPQLHGEIVHSALRRLWSEIGDSEGLLASVPGAWSARAEAAAHAAIAEARRQQGRSIDALAWEVEHERCVRLLLADVAIEASRPPFRLIADERTELLQLGNLQLRVRLDRVDQRVATDAGAAPRRVLIDYKTGKVERADFESMRPTQVQLQAYAQLVDGLCAAVTLHLHKGEARWAGAVEDRDAIGALKPLPLAWPELQQRWRAMLHQLGSEFAMGKATVDPLKIACQRCDFQLLCRIDAETLEDNLAAADDEAADE